MVTSRPEVADASWADATPKSKIPATVYSIVECLSEELNL
jgi:hypothetical protein